MMSTMYGLKTIRKLESKEIVRCAEKYGIAEESLFLLDSGYVGYLRSLDTTLYKTQVKNHLQPLQAMYFDAAGSLVSFHINCYAGGFPNLQWNRNEAMNVFPPKPQAPADSILPLELLTKYLNPTSPRHAALSSPNDYTVVVFWNRFMGRQSKRLVRTVQDNLSKASTSRVRVVYVNNDEMFLKR